MSASEIFDQMVNTYDDLRELWYAWLFSRLHYIIAKELIEEYNPETVLDVGCGTGFQSFLHAATGAFVVGFDIAKGLVEVANKKALFFRPEEELILFPVHYEFVDRYNKTITSLLSNKIRNSKYTPPNFQVADARYLPFRNGSFDHINCCGSTLCFVKDHYRALSEIARVLTPGGTLLLEGDSRWNMDRLWSVIDAILKSRLGYYKALGDALRSLFTPPTEYISNKYPLGKPESQTCNIKAFTVKGLKHELSSLHLKVLKRWTVHSVTNFIPSPYLELVKPPKWLITLFTFLANIEERLPVALPGLSSVYLVRKELV